MGVIWFLDMSTPQLNRKFNEDEIPNSFDIFQDVPRRHINMDKIRESVGLREEVSLLFQDCTTGSWQTSRGNVWRITQIKRGTFIHYMVHGGSFTEGHFILFVPNSPSGHAGFIETDDEEPLDVDDIMAEAEASGVYDSLKSEAGKMSSFGMTHETSLDQKS